MFFADNVISQSIKITTEMNTGISRILFFVTNVISQCIKTITEVKTDFLWIWCFVTNVLRDQVLHLHSTKMSRHHLHKPLPNCRHPTHSFPPEVAGLTPPNLRGSKIEWLNLASHKRDASTLEKLKKNRSWTNQSTKNTCIWSKTWKKSTNQLMVCSPSHSPFKILHTWFFVSSDDSRTGLMDICYKLTTFDLFRLLSYIFTVTALVYLPKIPTSIVLHSKRS